MVLSATVRGPGGRGIALRGGLFHGYELVAEECGTRINIARERSRRSTANQ